MINLSKFQPGDAPKDRDFLQRYLKLTHCDLFFADAAILVEGNVERLLLPIMIEKAASGLRSASLSILEVGGAFAHRFRELIRFLGISTLLITDLDSVTAVDGPANDDDDEIDREFQVPSKDEVGTPLTKYGRTCEPLEPGAVTANQTLIQWLPKKETISDLTSSVSTEKMQDVPGTGHAKVRVAYQLPCQVSWAGNDALACGRTLEVCFGLENAKWCQDAERRGLGLKLRGHAETPAALASGLHKRIVGKNFDKTKFALEILARKEEQWSVPSYIAEGLKWLEGVVALEVRDEVAASA